MPQFTVAITAWRRPELLPRILLDLLDQEADDWDALILGDGPIPHLRAVFEEFRAADGDPRLDRFALHELPRREGLWGNHLRRWALENAAGDYTAILGHDCRVSPLYLDHHLHNIRRRPGALSLVDCRVWTVRPLGNPHGQLLCPQYLGVQPGRRDPRHLQLAQVDLTCMALPTAAARDLGCFAGPHERVYSADHAAYVALRDAVGVEATPGPVAAHF